MRVFLQFITVGICDNKPVINSLIQNIASDSIKVSTCMLISICQVYVGIIHIVFESKSDFVDFLEIRFLVNIRENYTFT